MTGRCAIARRCSPWHAARLAESPLTRIDLRLTRKKLPTTASVRNCWRQLLDLLTSDGYLVRQENNVRFRSALLRRYWKEVQS